MATLAAPAVNCQIQTRLRLSGEVCVDWNITKGIYSVAAAYDSRYKLNGNISFPKLNSLFFILYDKSTSNLNIKHKRYFKINC
jgi:hypothetical protein